MKIEFPLQKAIILALLGVLIVADAGLAQYAMKSSSGFPRQELAAQKVQMELDATVNGDYKGVVRFLNGLQRSKNHYAIDGLALASEPTGLESHGALRVALHIRSYFRNTA